MSRLRYLDLLGLTVFKEKIINLFTNHTSNTDIHISADERDKINEAADTLDQANDAAQKANEAASFANSIGEELVTKLKNGEFNGKDGVIHTSTGQYSFKIIGDDLFLVYPDGDEPRNFQIDENGDLILTYDEE